MRLDRRVNQLRASMLVQYDVADDAARASLRGGLAPFAVRLQQSCWLVPGSVGYDPASLAGALGSLVAPGDRLRVHRPCRACRTTLATYPANRGEAMLLHNSAVYVVL